MSGKEYIDYRIETGDRFLASLHKDSRDLIALILEQYVALRQPLVIKSVCDGCGSRFDEMDIAVGVCYCCQKEIKQTVL